MTHDSYYSFAIINIRLKTFGATQPIVKWDSQAFAFALRMASLKAIALLLMDLRLPRHYAVGAARWVATHAWAWSDSSRLRRTLHRAV
jgi:hypothetical protein